LNMSKKTEKAQEKSAEKTAEKTEAHETPKTYVELVLTEDQIQKNILKQSEAAAKEFRDGFEFLEKYPHRVTFFGSARAMPESQHYKAAEELARRVSSELGLVVVTGSGPGIMEAANKGARAAREAYTTNENSPEKMGTGIIPPKTIGLSIGLPREQKINEYVDDSMNFNHFFARKAMLAFADKAYVFFPGGFGTLDELFGILTMIQTHKIPHVPVILLGSDFWKPLVNFIRMNMFENHGAISKGDMQIYKITDNHDQALDIIKNGPNSQWWQDAD
jgi:uncharacterized protein (TIGR00730 family)